MRDEWSARGPVPVLAPRPLPALLLATVAFLAAALSPAQANNGLGQPQSHDLTDCHIRQGLFAVPYELVAPQVPAPLKAAHYGGAPDGPYGQIDVAFLLCDTAVIGDRTIQQPMLMAAGIGLEAPPQPYAGAASTWYCTLAFVHEASELRVLYDHWGLAESRSGFVVRATTGDLLATSYDTMETVAGSLRMQATYEAPGTVLRLPETIRFLFCDGGVHGGMDANVGQHIVALGPGSFDVTGASGWMLGMPAHADGAVADVSHDGWNINMQRVTFAAGGVI